MDLLLRIEQTRDALFELETLDQHARTSGEAVTSVVVMQAQRDVAADLIALIAQVDGVATVSLTTAV
jgi:hypothetical protein